MSDPIDPDVPELADLPGEAKLSADLERRIVASLRREGLLAGSREAGRGSRWRWLPAAAAAVLLVAGGLWLGARFGGAPLAEEPNYIFLLREDDAYRTAPVGREMERVGEYKSWAEEMGRLGMVVGGMKLGEEAAVLLEPGRAGGATAGMRPSGGVAGLFMIRSRDMDAARKLAESCPHLRYGGIIEIRPIEGS